MLWVIGLEGMRKSLIVLQDVAAVSCWNSVLAVQSKDFKALLYKILQYITERMSNRTSLTHKSS